MFVNLLPLDLVLSSRIFDFRFVPLLSPFSLQNSYGAVKIVSVLFCGIGPKENEVKKALMEYSLRATRGTAITGKTNFVLVKLFKTKQ